MPIHYGNFAYLCENFRYVVEKQHCNKLAPRRQQIEQITFYPLALLLLLVLLLLVHSSEEASQYGI